MKIFLSWSGERSRAVAVALRDWLETLNPSFEPWMSEEDIEKGQRWSASIANELGTSKVGVICVTPENAAKPWLNFEAGAISRTITDAYVCPLLLDLAPADLTGPLKEFQATRIEKADIFKLIETFNRALKTAGEKAFDPGPLEKAFDRAWPDLESQLAVATKPIPTASRASPKRSEREIFEEILEIARRLERGSHLSLFRRPAPSSFHPLIQASTISLTCPAAQNCSSHPKITTMGMLAPLQRLSGQPGKRRNFPGKRSPRQRAMVKAPRSESQRLVLPSREPPGEPGRSAAPM